MFINKMDILHIIILVIFISLLCVALSQSTLFSAKLPSRITTQSAIPNTTLPKIQYVKENLDYPSFINGNYSDSSNNSIRYVEILGNQFKCQMSPNVIMTGIIRPPFVTINSGSTPGYYIGLSGKWNSSKNSIEWDNKIVWTSINPLNWFNDYIYNFLSLIVKNFLNSNWSKLATSLSFSLSNVVTSLDPLNLSGVTSTTDTSIPSRYYENRGMGIFGGKGSCGHNCYGSAIIGNYYGNGIGKLPDVTCPGPNCDNCDPDCTEQRGVGALAWCDNGIQAPWDFSTCLPYIECKNNYVEKAGLCYKPCDPGYRDMGLICAKNVQACGAAAGGIILGNIFGLKSIIFENFNCIAYNDKISLKSSFNGKISVLDFKYWIALNPFEAPCTDDSWVQSVNVDKTNLPAIISDSPVTGEVNIELPYTIDLTKLTFTFLFTKSTFKISNMIIKDIVTFGKQVGNVINVWLKIFSLDNNIFNAPDMVQIVQSKLQELIKSLENYIPSDALSGIGDQTINLNYKPTENIPTTKPSYIPTTKPSYIPTPPPKPIPTTPPTYLTFFTDTYTDTSNNSKIFCTRKGLYFDCTTDSKSYYWSPGTIKGYLDQTGEYIRMFNTNSFDGRWIGDSIYWDNDTWWVSTRRTTFLTGTYTNPANNDKMICTQTGSSFYCTCDTQSWSPATGTINSTGNSLNMFGLTGERTFISSIRWSNGSIWNGPTTQPSYIPTTPPVLRFAVPDFATLQLKMLTADQIEPGSWSASATGQTDSSMNGVYTTTASRFWYGTNSTYGSNNVFNRKNPSVFWKSRTTVSNYNSGTGAYLGATTTIVNNLYVKGEWLSIIVPNSFVLKSYRINTNPTNKYNSTWTLAGSNDGGKRLILIDRQSLNMSSVANGGYNGIVTVNLSKNTQAYSMYIIIIEAGFSNDGGAHINKLDLYK